MEERDRTSYRVCCAGRCRQQGVYCTRVSAKTLLVFYVLVLLTPLRLPSTSPMKPRRSPNPDTCPHPPALGGASRASSAVHPGRASSCIQGEGDPPHELLLAAVACAASGKVRGVPVERLREDDAIDELNLSVGVTGATLLGLMLPATTSVCSLKYATNRNPNPKKPLP